MNPPLDESAVEAQSRKGWRRIGAAATVACVIWAWVHYTKPSPPDSAAPEGSAFPWSKHGDTEPHAAELNKPAGAARADPAGGKLPAPTADPADKSLHDALARYTVTRQQVLQDGSLSPLDKARRLSELRAALPAKLKASLPPGDNVNDLNALIADWSTSKGNAQELRALREEVVGVRGADQLEALDTFRRTWAQDIHNFSIQRRAVMTDPSLSDLQRTEALARLREQTQAELERLRGQAPIGDDNPLVNARAP